MAGIKFGYVLMVYLSIISPIWGQNYLIESQRVVVDKQGHWNNWQFVDGTLNISPSGEVTPVFVHKKNNAVSDILKHLQRASDKPEEVSLLDGIEAGTNKKDVAHLFDGDETTYWEPDSNSPLRDWWFQIDMGRLINATRIKLTFVSAGQGDPFLQFAVLTADNANKGEQVAGQFPLYQVFRTARNNKDERIFEIDLDRGEIINSLPGRDFEGEMVRFVQVTVTESDSLRGTEVTQLEHEKLAAADIGHVVFYKKVGTGEVEVEAALYEVLKPEARGAVRYYRRERPRLAELEIYELGENISQGLVRDRKGSAESSHEGAVGNLVDGEGTYLTFNLAAFPTVDTKFGERYLEFDLGAYYWLDTVQMWYNLFAAGGRMSQASFNNYEIKISDGTAAPSGGLLWEAPAQQRGLGKEFEVNTFKSRVVRYLRVAYAFYNRTHGGEGTKARIREVQLYGEGYHPQVELISGLIPLSGAKNLASIEWDADIGAGTSVQIQTRTGNEVADEYRYFDKGGVEVSEGKYQKLGFFKKGRIDTLQIAGADWSNWSAPYAQSGTAIVSPSPRKYLMVKARLTTEDPLSMAALRSIYLNFNPPLAQQLRGELDISVFDQLGVPQEISLFVKPTFISQDIGFDEILLRAPSDMKLEFNSLRMGTVAQWNNDQAQEITDVQIVETRSDSLWLRLNDIVQRGSQGDLIEVKFNTALFSTGVVLQAAMGNSALENSWQQVDPGDVTDRAQSQGLQILSAANDNKILDDVEFSSPVITPNSDGINDALQVSFNVRRLSGERPVNVQIFDLSGRPVKLIKIQQAVVAGNYSLSWSADDQQGQVVPPGIYLLRLSVDVDSNSRIRQTQVQRVLHVVY